MRPYQHAALLTALLLALACSSAQAQENGLRIKPEADQTTSAIGLKLRLVDSRSNIFSLPEEAPIRTALRSIGNNKTFSSVMADWPLTSNGLRASVGLVWQYRQDQLGENHREELASFKNPETFVGLGWSGEPFGTRNWRFSADLGSFITSKRGSQETVNSRSRIGDTNLWGGDNGLQWKPYFAIGMQLRY